MKEYKNRKMDVSLKIDFYRCLNRKGFIFSVRQNGNVVAHTDKIILKECEFIVNKSAKNQCIKTNSRNVHAFIRGFIGNTDSIKNRFSYILNYNPYIEKLFYTSEGELNRCDVVYIQENKIYCQ